MNTEEINYRISRLRNEIAELNKKLSAVVLSEDEKNAAMTGISRSVKMGK